MPPRPNQVQINLRNLAKCRDRLTCRLVCPAPCSLTLARSPKTQCARLLKTIYFDDAPPIRKQAISDALRGDVPRLSPHCLKTPKLLLPFRAGLHDDRAAGCGQKLSIAVTPALTPQSSFRSIETGEDGFIGAADKSPAQNKTAGLTLHSGIRPNCERLKEPPFPEISINDAPQPYPAEMKKRFSAPTNGRRGRADG